MCSRPTEASVWRTPDAVVNNAQSVLDGREVPRVLTALQGGPPAGPPPLAGPSTGSWAPPGLAAQPPGPAPTAMPLLPPPPFVPPAAKADGRVPVWLALVLGVVVAAATVAGAAAATGVFDGDDPAPVEEVVGPAAPTTTLTTTVLDLVGDPFENVDIGDCWSDRAVPSLVETSDEVEFTEMACDEPHQAEVYAVARHLAPHGSPYPGIAEIDQLIERECYPHWEPYVGIPLEESVFNTIALYPSERAWLFGDRIVVCSVYPLDGTLLTTGVRGVGR